MLALWSGSWILDVNTKKMEVRSGMLTLCKRRFQRKWPEGGWVGFLARLSFYWGFTVRLTFTQKCVCVSHSAKFCISHANSASQCIYIPQCNCTSCSVTTSFHCNSTSNSICHLSVCTFHTATTPHTMAVHLTLWQRNTVTVPFTL